MERSGAQNYVRIDAAQNVRDLPVSLFNVAKAVCLLLVYLGADPAGRPKGKRRTDARSVFSRFAKFKKRHKVLVPFSRGQREKRRERECSVCYPDLTGCRYRYGSTIVEQLTRSNTKGRNSLPWLFQRGCRVFRNAQDLDRTYAAALCCAETTDE